MMVDAGEPPDSVKLGRPSKLERTAAWWATRYLGNMAQIRYDAMIVDIQAAAAVNEAAAFAMVKSLQTGSAHSAAALKAALDKHAAAVLASQWELMDDLMVKCAAPRNTAAPRAATLCEDWRCSSSDAATATRLPHSCPCAFPVSCRRYADGALVTVNSDGTVAAKALGYPQWWLSNKDVNFTAGPARLPGPAHADQEH